MYIIIIIIFLFFLHSVSLLSCSALLFILSQNCWGGLEFKKTLENVQFWQSALVNSKAFKLLSPGVFGKFVYSGKKGTVYHCQLSMMTILVVSLSH